MALCAWSSSISSSRRSCLSFWSAAAALLSKGGGCGGGGGGGARGTLELLEAPAEGECARASSASGPTAVAAGALAGEAPLCVLA